MKQLMFNALLNALRNRPFMIALVMACIFRPSLAVETGPGHSTISFNKDIRPILSDKCFACHGFDAKNRQADLRLDTADDAHADRDGQFALVPGDPDKSLVWQRIMSTDDDLLMPPASSHKQLSDSEKQLLLQWIEQGANYQSIGHSNYLAVYRYQGWLPIQIIPSTHSSLIA